MAVANRLAKRDEKEAKTSELRSLVNKMAPGIQRALPAMIGKERFIRCALSAISSNEALSECSNMSFVGALMNAAQLGLEPNTPLGQAYLIPYKGKVQFQLGYKGMIELAKRAGITIQVHEICANDVFEYEYGLDPKLRHVPTFKDRGPVIGYYCLWKNKDEQFGIEVASKEEISNFAKTKSQAYTNGPWKTDFDAMAKKTMIKRALKYAPVAVEIAEAMVADESVKNVNLADVNAEGFDINLVEPEQDAAEKEMKVEKDTGEVVDAEVIKKQAPKSAPEPSDQESLI